MEFLIWAGLLFFVIFALTDIFTTITQNTIACSNMHYFKDRIRIEGYLTAEDETNMINRFNSVGMTIDEIICPRESQGDSRVLMTPSNPSASTIDFKLSVKPAYRPFVAGFLIGEDAAPDSFRFRPGGTVLSERVDE